MSKPKHGKVGCRKSYEFAGLRAAPATHRARNTANTTFSCRMLQNAGFGTIPWGGEGGGVANREPGSYIYILYDICCTCYNTVKIWGLIWNFPLGPGHAWPIFGKNSLSQRGINSQPQGSLYMTPTQTKHCFIVKIPGNDHTFVSSWWLNQPIWKICSSNWIVSPRIGDQICMVWSPKNLLFSFATRRGIIRHNNFSNARRLPKGKFHWGSCTKIGIIVVVTVTVITVTGKELHPQKILNTMTLLLFGKKHNQNNTFGGVEKVLYINTYCI